MIAQCLRRDGHTALMWAVYKGHLDIVRRLVDAKADVDAKDTCAALWSAVLGLISSHRILSFGG